MPNKADLSNHSSKPKPQYRYGNLDINNQSQDANIAWSQSREYKLFFRFYLLFIIIITAIIEFKPHFLVNQSILSALAQEFAKNLPGLTFLASLSSSPADVIWGYTIAFLSAPVHCAVFCYIYYKSYRYGFLSDVEIKNLCKAALILPSGFYIIFMTCLICKDEPHPFARLLIYSDLLISLFGQAFSVMTVTPLACLFLIFIKMRRRR